MVSRTDALRISEPGQLLFAGFEGTQLPDDLAGQIADGRVGGIVLFARNIADPEQLRALTDSAHALAPEHAPLTIAIDQEGGRVQRLREPWTEWPPMRVLGALDNLTLTRAVGQALGRELADFRIDLDFAPVADVDSNPANPIIGDRSFSANPAAVARHACALAEGLIASGVGACGKHFPGHGDTAQDSHTELPRLDYDWERLEAVELPPFRALVENGLPSLMTAHVVLGGIDGNRPATLSRPVLSYLRSDLGYDGLVFSDDLEMAAVAAHHPPETLVRDSIHAGVDALLVCSRSDLREEVLRCLEALPPASLESALRRMTAFKREYSGGRHASGGTPPYPQHGSLAAELLSRPQP
ncbi:beta-N-acetylhexosaminidase [Myxococcota bacterium]|nr:beta-N-acetylhexosaminidase [Myxococcota bacterium]